MPTRTQIEARDQAATDSPEDESRYVMTLFLPHRHFEAVEAQVRARMVVGTGLPIIFIGPSGVGKKTVARYRSLKLLSSYAVQI
ncbi:hypothetical protein [Paraburkholderia phenoliruptrix]|uniref:hypothetical protein n=1 Tax=Paraburkholderia phenoliruptrix TaxID=252970 RepID=UPI002869E428|nr:hypothetical protein [Paraburkholderia phenoliruptrix]WMY11752.1 hypothetical protein P3F88_20280 [Paraburkholderia phenoliruptrix]